MADAPSLTPEPDSDAEKTAPPATSSNGPAAADADPTQDLLTLLDMTGEGLCLRELHLTHTQ